jgi:hypothetical protein
MDLGWGFMQTSPCVGRRRKQIEVRNVLRLGIVDFLVAGPGLEEKNYSLGASLRLIPWHAGMAIEAECSASCGFWRERESYETTIRHPLPEPAVCSALL